MVYWSFNSFSLLIADLTVTAEVVLKKKKKSFELKKTKHFCNHKILTPMFQDHKVPPQHKLVKSAVWLCITGDSVMNCCN